MESLLNMLIQPWLFPAIVVILAAFFSAYFTLRANIRQRAWYIIYQDKRREIRGFLRTADEFASTILHIGEVLDIMGRSPLDQYTALLFQGRRMWGPDLAVGPDPVGRQFVRLFPTLQQAMAATPAALQALQNASRVLLNALEERLQHLNLQMGELKTTMALSVRNPDTMSEAQNLVAETYKEVHAGRPAFQNFDYDGFPERWSKRITITKLALREDLAKSSRSLGALLRLSWSWRIRRWIKRRLAG